ncbi:quinone oxidoreductase [Deinococcus aerolatus]|uniref:Quinone oxidoreductase n=1 Tax=Deinococcus aerolatus TaxID=522487 RepID=A0ABQ2G053_9DEIO|nr:MDR family oxidoreductase [Deinococcus aerolatus]GGL68175.1 quinone oxidoreductase [Deinococcus aerolatus]
MSMPTPPDTYRALRVTQDGERRRAELQTLPLSALPDGDVLIAVSYSSLNYKDGLAVTGQGILRSVPMTPGIDLAGTVLEDRSGIHAPGDAVILTGWGIGERQDGGYATHARAEAGWLVRQPAGTDAVWAMSVGTAGFTAMLAVMALEDAGVRPGDGEVLVTGAAGGVGSTAIALLSAAGFTVTASTGRSGEEAYLRELGASTIIPREELPAMKRPLEKERWSGVVDSVGGETLAGAYASTRTHGALVVCGIAGGTGLNTTVFPLILRGVSLLGIDSVTCPQPRREAAWARLARDLPASRLASVTRTHGLSEVTALAPQILAGQVRGRTVIDVNG